MGSTGESLSLLKKKRRRVGRPNSDSRNFWKDNFAVPKSAPHPDNAKIFINWIMAPENIAQASNFTGYNNAIEGSDKFMDKALSADPAVAMPAADADRLRDIKNCSQAARDLNDKVWTRLKK